MYFLILLMITASQDMQANAVATSFAAPFRNSALLQVRIPPAPKPVTLSVQPSQTTSGNCVIPLLNALKDDKSTKSNMPIVKPQGKYNMPIVTPVPICGSQEK